MSGEALPLPFSTSGPQVRRSARPGVSGVVARAQRGDRGAFETIYREQVGRVYALCLRLSEDRAEADELVQDVFVRAWERLRTFRGEAAFSSWLYRLTVNVVHQHRRASARRERRVRPVAELPPTPGPGTGPGGALDLERAIAGLPPGARTVFVLHDVHGYAHSEIADMLGIAPGTSKAHLHRARRQLREVLQ